MSKLRVVHKLVQYILFILLATSCNKKTDNKEGDKIDMHLSNLLVEDALNSLIKYKKDTLLLQDELKKSIEINDTILQLAINKKLGQIHADNCYSRSAVLHKKAYLILAQSIANSNQELIALNDLGKYYYEVDIYDDALRFYFEALNVSEKIEFQTEEVKKELSNTKLGIGLIYILFDNKEYASNWFDESIGLAKLIDDKELIADIYMAKSDLSKEKHQYDSAKIYIDKAINGYIAQNSTAGLGNGFLKLGTLSFDLDDYRDAIISLENALGILQNTTERVNIMKSNLLLGKLHLRLYNYPMAEKYLMEADKISKELNSLIYRRNCNMALSEMYYAKKNIDASRHYNDLARKLESETNHSKIQAGIFNAYMEYENSKNKQAIENLEAEYSLRSNLKNTIIFITLITIALLIIAFFIFDRYWKKRRYKNEAIISSALLKVNLFNHISMELKSPLTIIDGLVERLKESIGEENRTSNIINLEVIELQTQNIKFLINETLSLSQSKYNVKSNWVNGDIVCFLRFLFHSFIEDAKSRGVDILFLTNQKEINMNFCKDRLQLVIINILYITIRNSVKNDKIFLSINYNDTETTCQISIQHKGVETNREEIPSEFRTILSEFNRSELHPSKNYTLLRQTIEDMGGTFSMEGNNGNETFFNLSFAVKNNKQLEKYDIEQEVDVNELPNKEIIEKDIVTINKSFQNNKNKKELIMIIDDNQFMSFYISSLISNKYNVITCQTGVEALKEIEKKQPDLIITDLVLPQMDGNQFTEIIKRTPSTSHIPIIMNIVKDSNASRIKAIKAGVDAFLVKPFIEEELHALVDQLLKSRKGLLKTLAQSLIDKQISKDAIMEEEDIAFIQKVSNLIHDDISNFDLSTHQLADKMHISTSHLNRKIKTITELSTIGFILNIRLNRAKKILITTQKPIGDVAMECGFSDFAYFSRTFKKEFGITPSHYQRMGVE